LRAQGDLGGAEPLLELALALRRETLRERHPATAAATLALGKLRADQGRFAQSEELIKSASSDLETLLGPRHLDFVASREDLASVYLARGKYKEARTAIERAINAVDTDRSSRITRRLETLAAVEDAAGNYAEAKRLLEIIVEGREDDKKRVRARFLN